MKTWQRGCLAAIAIGVLAIGCDAPSSSDTESGDPPPPAAAENGGETRRPAEVGVGRSSQRMNQHDEGVGRMVAQPAVTLFTAREKVVFEIQIPQAMNLYKATHGKFPDSHEAFMRDIIEFNRIPLPDLPDGQRYEYDAESAQLMVVMPEN